MGGVAGHFLIESYQLLGVSCLRKVNKKDGRAFILHPNTLDNVAGGIFRRKDNIRQQTDDSRINNRTAGATMIRSSPLRR